MGDPHTTKLRLGVLPPGSNFVPFLASDLLAALEFGFAESGLQAEFVVDFAGYNADPKVLLPKVQELLVMHRVACVIAPLNVSLIEKLAGQFQSQATPLVVLSLGEDPLFESAVNPYVFVNSFQLWRTAWMCGYLGARRFGPRAATMVAMHEGGYGLNFAFQLGLEAANGSLLQTVVTHRNSNTEDPSPSLAAVTAHKPDFIWAAYSSKEAVSFLAAYHASGSRPKPPVLGLPPLVDNNVREAAGSSALGVYFMTPGRQTARDISMKSALAQAIGRSPHPYALLAYEAAHLVASAARALDNAGCSFSGLPQMLRAADLDGPRGLVRFDNGEESETPFCFGQVGFGEDSMEEIEAPPLLTEQSLLARRRLFKQGWINPYLCA